ncbi:fungal-specific transcription factor domain-containing protein, partial [Auriculariales sp. MPI-PUGE-AT-0066]
MRQAARACDFCRQRKRRCDGPKLPHRICTTCSSLSMECTYGDDIKRTPEVSKCYVAMLEARLAKVEKLVKQHSTEKMLMPEVGCIMSYQLPSFDPIHIRANIAANSKIDSMLAPWQTDTISHPSSIIEAFQKEVAANGNAEETAGSLKPHARRPYYWSTPAHEFRGETMASRAFDPHLPLPDELAMLTRYFFDQYNVFNGVLHRGLFEQQLLDETILSDPLFVALVLLVCAIGERTLSSSQERGEDVSNPPGWRFFEQVEPFLRAPPPVKPRLLYQQILVLSTIYLMTTPGDMSLTWIVFGMSVQASYYANANCRKAYHQRPNLTDELWKRAFWQMVVLDRLVASIRGQPVIIPDEAFDLELPLDVEDDHWDLSNPAEGYPLMDSVLPNLTQPSSSGFLIWRIRLSLILGFALRTLYCNNKSRMMMAFVGSDWEWRTINRLGRLLREWEVSIPTQFRWDPDCPDLLTYIRSANLYANFYILQITAFNPFI